MKLCKKCNEEKELSCFNKNKNSKNGLSFYCKKCIKEYQKRYREINREALNRKLNKYYHSKEGQEKRKAYYKENKERILKTNQRYKSKRRKEDRVFYLKCTLSNNIRNSIKKIGFVKSKKTEEILGCDLSFFKSYIESKFQKGMTLDNHGEWHIDHVIPISTAKTEEDVIALNHYTNLQPLWSKDNLHKSDNIIEGTQLNFI